MLGIPIRLLRGISILNYVTANYYSDPSIATLTMDNFTSYIYHLLSSNVCNIFDLCDNKASLSRWFSLHGVTRVEDMLYIIFSVWWHKLNGIKFDFSTYSEGSTAFAKAMLAARKRYKAAPPAIFALRKNNEIRTFI